MSNDIVSYKAQLAEQARKYAAAEPLSGGDFLSIKGGILSVGGEVMPGNQICVIILDSVRENTYFTAKYDPDAAASPTCYAFGRTDEEMAPHHTMQVAPDYFIPQAESCTGCPHAEWGSSDTGRGKACQNRRRLALIPAGYYQAKRGSRDFDLEIFTDPEHYASAEMAFLKLPVLSVKNYAAFVNEASASFRMPPYGVIARLYVEPDPKAQFVVKFDIIEEIPEEIIPAVIARHEAALNQIITGYSVPQEPEAPAPKGGILKRR